jgi:transcriptional regulator with PAS, ATPase and Fis domain
VGQEVLARFVHESSPRAPKPFVCINCAALAETLLESELFGHEKGAFTGAVAAKTGLLEAAEGGTVFLDEVGEMSLALQAKLLRTLERREILRVGGTRPRAIDVRFVAATNRDLEEEVAQKTFRQDLYYRLAGITLTVPPLRERLDEVEPLARSFLQAAAAQLGRPVPDLGPEVVARLRAYAWPGNVRELKNVMERALVLADPNGRLGVEALPFERLERTPPPAAGDAPARPAGAADRAPAGASWRDQKAAEEKQAICDALARCAGNQTRAAELLGMPRRTLCAKLKEYAIPRPRT